MIAALIVVAVAVVAGGALIVVTHRRQWVHAAAQADPRAAGASAREGAGVMAGQIACVGARFLRIPRQGRA